MCCCRACSCPVPKANLLYIDLLLGLIHMVDEAHAAGITQLNVL